MCAEWATIWSAVSAIATAVGAGGIWFAFQQIRFAALLKAQDIWVANEFREARGRIFARLETGDRNWTEEQEAEALQICRKMDEFAGLVPYMPKRTALRIWGVPFAQAWFLLEPVVNKERAKCRWPEKWHAFERLGRESLTSHPEVRKNSILSRGAHDA